MSALSFAPESLATAAELKLPTVLMHAQGGPETMQANPAYRDAVIEVYDFLEARIAAAIGAGLPRECIVADPGIGFGKTLAHNLAILQSIAIFHGLGVPLMVGSSRKGFVQKLTGAENPKQTTQGSVAAALDAIAQGVQIVRVHDVREPAKGCRSGRRFAAAECRHTEFLASQSSGEVNRTARRGPTRVFNRQPQHGGSGETLEALLGGS